MQTKYLCVLIHIWIKGEADSWRHLTGLSPPVKYFTGLSKAVLLLWIFYVFCSVLCLLWLCARLFICALWSPAGKGLTSWLSFVVSICEFVIFPLLAWVRCGTWLYRFLIFALLLTNCTPQPYYNLFITSAQIQSLLHRWDQKNDVMKIQLKAWQINDVIR